MANKAVTNASLNAAATKNTKGAKKGGSATYTPPPYLPVLFPNGTTIITQQAGAVKGKDSINDPLLGQGKAVVRQTEGVSTVDTTGTKLFLQEYDNRQTQNQTLTVVNSSSFTIAGGVSKAVQMSQKVETGVTSNPTQDFVGPQDTRTFLFNLSPHSWSLPIDPTTVDHRRFVKTNKASGSTKADVLGTNPNGAANPRSPLRRGRITWHASASNEQYSGVTKGMPSRTGKEREMGFQFLWNPETFSTQVQLNAEVTPSLQDRFVSVAGAFPGTESISLVVRLDRTFDFACFAHLGDKERDPKKKTTGLIPKRWLSYKDFYKGHKLGFSPDWIMEKQIKELYELGTLHDIEFLYQTINGPNANYMKGGWKNSLGRVTSDIGFLSATLVKFEIGPLNYLGYITAVSVQHIAFTQDMKPIRSDVSIQANLLASVGISEAK
jgi:hypothetical protein